MFCMWPFPLRDDWLSNCTWQRFFKRSPRMGETLCTHMKNLQSHGSQESWLLRKRRNWQTSSILYLGAFKTVLSTAWWEVKKQGERSFKVYPGHIVPHENTVTVCQLENCRRRDTHIDERTERKEDRDREIDERLIRVLLCTQRNTVPKKEMRPYIHSQVHNSNFQRCSHWGKVQTRNRMWLKDRNPGQVFDLEVETLVSHVEVPGYNTWLQFPTPTSC